MVARTDALPITRQCELLDLPRSTFYHVPDPVSDAERIFVGDNEHEFFRRRYDTADGINGELLNRTAHGCCKP